MQETQIIQWPTEMRKYFSLTIPFVLIFILVVTFLLIHLHRPLAWQTELDHYILFKNITSSDSYVVQTIIRANRPWNFTKEMSKISMGESAYYQTDFRYGEESPDHKTFSIIPKEFSNGSLIPLPYPPEELWCVTLQQEKPSESNYSSKGINFVIVALHQDLYNADYVIHEIALETTGGIENKVLAAVGCTFP